MSSIAILLRLDDGSMGRWGGIHGHGWKRRMSWCVGVGDGVPWQRGEEGGAR